MGNTDNIVVSKHWKTRHYGTLGLSDILSLEGYVVMEDVEDSIADHVVKLHNDWWTNRVWATYMPNIEWTFYNTLTG